MKDSQGQPARIHIIDTETGEVFSGCPGCIEREETIEALQGELQVLLRRNGRLKKDLTAERLEEPEHQAILRVLSHWKLNCKPRAEIVPGGKRWERVRARFHDKLPGGRCRTPDELMLVVDGALTDDWLTGRAPGARDRGYLDVDTLYRDPEQVERLVEKALTAPAEVRVLHPPMEVWALDVLCGTCGHRWGNHLDMEHRCCVDGCHCRQVAVEATDAWVWHGAVRYLRGQKQHATRQRLYGPLRERLEVAA